MRLSLFISALIWVILAAGPSELAFAQSGVSCVANAGVPLLLRAEGAREPLSDIVMTCTGGTPTAAGAEIPIIVISLNSAPMEVPQVLDFSGGVTYLIDEPTPDEQILAPQWQVHLPASGTGVYKGSGRPTVFPPRPGVAGIPFDPPGPGKQRVIRITNLRGDAASLASASSANPLQLQARIGVSGYSGSFAITNFEPAVGYITKGLEFTVTAGANANPCSSGSTTIRLAFKELFGEVFKEKGGGSGNLSQPSTAESRFVSSTFASTYAAKAGLATNGTRLVARFTGIPTGVTLTVPTTLSSSTPETAMLVPEGVDGSTANAAGLLAVTNGEATAVWEVTVGSYGHLATLAANVTATYSNPQPGVIQVQGYLGPLKPANPDSSTWPIPYFVPPASAPATALTVTQCPGSANPTYPTLQFSALSPNGPTTVAQSVAVNFSGAAHRWSAVADQPWLSVSPASGSAATPISVSLVPGSIPAPGAYTGKVTVSPTDAYGAPVDINVTLKVSAASAAPFGSFDTPLNNSTGLSGNIPVNGWALDDIGVDKVTLWRDPLPSEPVHANGYVYIGDATFVPGARPDVANAYPSAPQNYRAGWGYMLLTNYLRSASGPSGNGTHKLHVIATDLEGKSTHLGSRTITVSNATAVKPFGTIDTPAQGATISGGDYHNFGWALTPLPATIPTDGSTIWLWIDGQPLGHPTYNLYRSDIATLFPGYNNAAGAVGHFALNTLNFTNGLHNIAWSVEDNQGHVDGVGSRYFSIVNAELPTSLPAAPPDATRAAVRTTRRDNQQAGPLYRTGFNLDAPLQPVEDGIRLSPLSRLEIQLPPGDWSFAGDGLPVGSTFDAGQGIFHWHPGPAFAGDFTLQFTDGGQTIAIPVRIQQP